LAVTQRFTEKTQRFTKVLSILRNTELKQLLKPGTAIFTNSYKKILFLGYLLIISMMSLMPSDNLPHLVLFPYADKLVHCFMYAGFTFLLFLAWPERFRGYRQLYPLLLVLCWGFAMEYMQGIGNAGRSFELSDELANIAGFIPGWVLWRFIKR